MSLFPVRDVWSAGRIREYYWSMPFWPYGHIRPVRIREKAGKSLRMPWSGDWMMNGSISCLCCGGRMLRKKGLLSTVLGIVYWRLPILPRCLQTGAFSDASISVKPMPISGVKDWQKSSGDSDYKNYFIFLCGLIWKIGRKWKNGC